VLARQAELRALTRKYAADSDGGAALGGTGHRAVGRDRHPATRAIAALQARRDELATELATHASSSRRPGRLSSSRRLSSTNSRESGMASPVELLRTTAARAAGASVLARHRFGVRGQLGGQLVLRACSAAIASSLVSIPANRAVACSASAAPVAVGGVLAGQRAQLGLPGEHRLQAARGRRPARRGSR